MKPINQLKAHQVLQEVVQQAGVPHLLARLLPKRRPHDGAVGCSRKHAGSGNREEAGLGVRGGVVQRQGLHISNLGERGLQVQVQRRRGGTTPPPPLQLLPPLPEVAPRRCTAATRLS